ncbi:hypothetical protein VDGL01_01204 [Verticillium dahliae]
MAVSSHPPLPSSPPPASQSPPTAQPQHPQLGRTMLLHSPVHGGHAGCPMKNTSAMRWIEQEHEQEHELALAPLKRQSNAQQKPKGVPPACLVCRSPGLRLSRQLRSYKDDPSNLGRLLRSLGLHLAHSNPVNQSQPRHHDLCRDLWAFLGSPPWLFLLTTPRGL